METKTPLGCPGEKNLQISRIDGKIPTKIINAVKGMLPKTN